eukprot:247291-Hanusia_phi.AAC.1
MNAGVGGTSKSEGEVQCYCRVGGRKTLWLGVEILKREGVREMKGGCCSCKGWGTARTRRKPGPGASFFPSEGRGDVGGGVRGQPGRGRQLLAAG